MSDLTDADLAHIEETGGLAEDVPGLVAALRETRAERDRYRDELEQLAASADDADDGDEKWPDWMDHDEPEEYARAAVAATYVRVGKRARAALRQEGGTR